MKCLTVCHTWFPIWGMKWNVCPSQSYVVSNMRNEMKCLSVSVIRGFQYEKWNEMLYVCHTWIPIWGMKWNVCLSQSYVVSNIRNEMKCLSVCHTWFPIWGMKWNVYPSVIRGFQYEEWINEMRAVRKVIGNAFQIWVSEYWKFFLNNSVLCLGIAILLWSTERKL